MDNLGHHTDLFELVTSSPIRGIRMGEMSKLGRLIALLIHAIRTDSLHLLLLLIPKILVSSQLTLCYRGR
jgi:hypothetical protein